MDYALIGGGNMGRALAAAVIERGVAPAERVLVVEPDPEAAARVRALGCTVEPQAGPAVGEAAVVVLAVKPQVAAEVCTGLRPLLGPEQAVVSIMAGVPLAALRGWLGRDALVRVMPNTPAQVGLGMNVFHAAPGVGPEQLRRVEALLGAAGETLAVASEDAIDAATAVSGSGPAYVFYLAEHWVAAAQALGFSAPEATRLVQQTLLGATALWREAGLSPAELRAQVTSKGGTTAAALEHFDAGQVGRNIAEGIARAYRRAKELGQ